MSLETEINLENHRDKCRCCLQEFEEDDSHIKITAIVQIRFQELTQIDVRQFSKVLICKISFDSLFS